MNCVFDKSIECDYKKTKNCTVNNIKYGLIKNYNNKDYCILFRPNNTRINNIGNVDIETVLLANIDRVYEINSSGARIEISRRDFNKLASTKYRVKIINDHIFVSILTR